jgi:hypothetical protein
MNAQVQTLYETLRTNLTASTKLSLVEAETLLQNYGEALTQMVTSTLESLKNKDGFPVSGTERHLRRLLCNSASGALAYRDDGEASDCSVEPHIDYMRDSPQQIEQCLQQRGVNKLKAMQKEAHELANHELHTSLDTWRAALELAHTQSPSDVEKFKWEKEIRLFDVLRPVVEGV